MVVVRSRRLWQPWPLYQSRRRILKLALLSRLIILLGMMISDRLIQDHDPGDDVLRFDLRLSSNCFCQEGLACLYDTIGTVPSCYHTEAPSLFRATVTGFYGVMLPPLTKWDAARFLSLAANPDMRQPKRGWWQEQECKDSENTQEICSSTRFIESEKSHAFLAGFPTLIRIVTRRVLRWIPWIILPPTYESVLVLVAWWINTIAFIFAALALHELTYCVAKKYVVARELCVECAYTSALLFCFNPASVFFSAAYSESLFCMMTFSGYFFAERNNHFLAVTCWVMASYTRSNGSLVVAWVILQTIARCLQPFQTLDGILSDLLSLFYQSFFILAPIIYHDWNGYYIHCVEAQEGFQPQWCNDAHPMFGLNHYLKYLEADDLIIYVKTYSLYKHVQSRYWNVGFLNYYEWKQIPNFLLAFPVLFLGATGALTWIWQSWKLFRKNEKVSNGETGKWWHMVLQPTRWALFALRVSKAPVEEAIKTLREREQPEVILVGPTLLAYYAVLAAACLVGATIAHVQISTRFIFSSCPAIYWFMSYICISDSKDESRSIMKKLLLSRSAMVCYCVGFILAGVTMHVNWLPWT